MKLSAKIDGDFIAVTVGFDADAEDGDVSVYEVMDGKADITHMLTADEMKAIEKDVYAELAKQAARNREDAAADRYEDRRNYE